MEYFEVDYLDGQQQGYLAKSGQFSLMTDDFTDCLRFFFEMNSICKPSGKVRLKLDGSIPARERFILEEIVSLYNQIPPFHKDYKVCRLVE